MLSAAGGERSPPLTPDGSRRHSGCDGVAPNGVQQVHNTCISLSSHPACPEPPPLPFCGLQPRDRSQHANIIDSHQVDSQYTGTLAAP